MSQHLHPHHRLGVNQFQRLHHLGGTFLVLLEMGGLEMTLVGLFVGVDFKDVDFARVFLGLHRKQCQHTGFHLDSGLAPFLVPAAAINAHQHLHLLMVDVPIVAAANSQF